MNLIIRPIEIKDKESWLPLWEGYLTFYETILSPEQTALTWNRLLDPDFNMYGLVAECEDEILGMTHFLFTLSTWVPINECYLEDLYVKPGVRGGGIGRALIDAVLERAKQAGSGMVYWDTAEDNELARHLYDSYASESNMIQYRIPVTPSKTHSSDSLLR